MGSTSHENGIGSPPLERVEIGGRAVEIVETTATRWLFNQAKRRFLRLPRHVDLDDSVLNRPWVSYLRLEADGSGRDVFVMLGRTARLRLHPITAG